ncbi:Hypothetical predicted protein [Olea europaea subsp. europaea]|uniref:Uncharacterized protein n=1 Tax=Olea europaea subsp. europaea TaxID=158383 RepID=A0A8S0SBD6_OLEEU|nr:Hypothetical predicted protein [Olea europaea subsp. europaea]
MRSDEYLNSRDRRRESVGMAEVKNRGEEENEEWDWERWRKHFAEYSQNAAENKNGLLDKNAKNIEEGDDDSGFENVFPGMIPGVKAKVVQVTTRIKADRKLISKLIEQIIDEEEEEKDFDLENVDTEYKIKGEIDDKQNEIDIDGCIPNK